MSGILEGESNLNSMYGNSIAQNYRFDILEDHNESWETYRREATCHVCLGRYSERENASSEKYEYPSGLQSKLGLVCSVS